LSLCKFYSLKKFSNNYGFFYLKKHHLVKCLAKTTVDSLIDADKDESNILRLDSTILSNDLNTSIENANRINANAGIRNNGQNLVTANNKDDDHISFHLKDNLMIETNH
jgi:hypothetical protein